MGAGVGSPTTTGSSFSVGCSGPGVCAATSTLVSGGLETGDNLRPLPVPPMISSVAPYAMSITVPRPKPTMKYQPELGRDRRDGGLCCVMLLPYLCGAGKFSLPGVSRLVLPTGAPAPV